MSLHVHSILEKAALKSNGLSPIDIVMGENWGEIDLGNSLRLSLLRYMKLKQEETAIQNRKGGVSSQQSRLRVPLSVMRGGNSAMVKVVKNGGTINARGMRDQMSYLEKDGEANLERSERYFGVELDDKSKERMIKTWSLSGENSTKSDKTTHFVVSFPHGTDEGAAYRAGRAWAETMFASGDYGDIYDYYTAFHTDRAHPHMHVVVNRRGMEEGDWLKVSRRSQFNYDEFRAVQVEVAAREGIQLDASPRYARGISDRPIPDAEIQRAKKEEREPKAPGHTPVTAIRSAAMIALHAQEMITDASLLEKQNPELAAAIKQHARLLQTGQQRPTKSALAPEFLADNFQQQNEIIMSRRSELLEGIEKIDAELSDIPGGPQKIALERQASHVKAITSEALPDVVELQLHIRDNPDGYYKGVKAEDYIELDIKARADDAAKEFSSDAGIKPEKFIKRYESDKVASLGLADQWRQDELEDIQKNLTYQEQENKGEAERLTQEAYEELHKNALQTYRQAERELEAHRLRKNELRRIAKLLVDGRELTAKDQLDLQHYLKDTVNADDIKQLLQGRSDVLNHITDNQHQQKEINKAFLEHELNKTAANERQQLQQVLNQVSKDTELVAQQARELESTQSRSKERGLDY